MKAYLVLAIGFVAAPAVAAPYVVSDPLDARATHCGWKLDAGTRTDVPVYVSGADKICRLDLAGLSVGSHTVSATAVAVDPVWGRMESVPSENFTLLVPGLPVTPSGLRIVP